MQADRQPPRLMTQARDRLRARHDSYRAEQSYLGWIKRYILFHNKRHPREKREPEIEAFVSHLAVQRSVSSSTQSQALSAVLFLYREVLQIELAWIDGISRARKREYVPVVLGREEVGAVLVSCPDGRT